MLVAIPARYPNACVPGAVAAVTGMSRELAAAHLAALQRKQGFRVQLGTPNFITKRVLERLGWTVETRYLGGKLTIQRWVARHSKGTYLVTSRNHMIAIVDGKVVEDNGVPIPRSQVRVVMKLERLDADEQDLHRIYRMT